MNAEKAFKVYWGMHLHLTSPSYCVLTYGMNTKMAQSKFDALSEFQRHRFNWLGTKFTDAQSLVYACLGCHFDGINMQFGNREDILGAYYKFKSRRESLTYSLKSDVSKHEMLDFIPVNKLIFKYLVGYVSPEYVILLCNGTNELDTLYKSPNLIWAKSKILLLIKYVPFFNAEKFLPLIELNEHHVTAE